MNFDKITPGCVIQTFNDAGECIRQKFVIYDRGRIEYETEDGEYHHYPINAPKNTPLEKEKYLPFDMVQPSSGPQCSDCHTINDFCSNFCKTCGLNIANMTPASRTTS